MKLCVYCAGEQWLFKSTSMNELVNYYEFNEMELEKYPYISVGGKDFMIHHTVKSVCKDFNPDPFSGSLFSDAMAFAGSVPVLYVFILDSLTIVIGFIILKLFLGLFVRFALRSKCGNTPVPGLIILQISWMSR